MSRRLLCSWLKEVSNENSSISFTRRFAEHRQKLAQLGVDSFEVRQLKDWNQPKDGLIIPGGESTTQAKLLNELGLMEPVKEAIAAGLPVYGTCAGLILLAKKLRASLAIALLRWTSRL